MAHKLWGILAEFDEPEALLDAANKTRAKGYKHLDAFVPFPINGLTEAVGKPKTKIQWLILLGGLVGGIGGFFMQWYANVISYPWNIGGRPLNSWPSFMPVTFELTVLCAACVAVFGMFALNGLPQPYHPVFNVDEFEQASRDKFYLCIEIIDETFDEMAARDFLRSLGSKAVYDVEP